MHFAQTRRLVFFQILAAAFLYLIGFSLHATLSLADACPAGTVPIGAGDRTNATAAGIPTSAACWNPSDSTVGNVAGAAKEFIKQHATSNANIACLNAQFAEKLAALMKAAPGGPPTVTDGYRGLAAQAQALASGASKVGPCGSYHQYGMAADFNNSSAQVTQWLRLNAPQYGLAPVSYSNPTTGCTPSGFCDLGHIQNGGGLPSRDQCGICATDNGGNGVLPASASSGQSSPTSALTNALCSLTNSCPQPSAVASPPPPASAPQTSPQTQQQTQCASNAVLYNGICYPAQTQSTTQSSNPLTTNPISSQLTNTNTNTNTNTLSTTTQGTSTSDLLNYYANYGGVSTSTHATNTPITLNSNTSDVSTLLINNTPDVTYAYATNGGVNPDGSGTTAGTNGNTDSSGNVISTVQPTTTAGQTFTSGDLNNSADTSGSTYSPAGTTFTEQLLENLKQVLLQILAFLTPFNGMAQQQSFE